MRAQGWRATGFRRAAPFVARPERVVAAVVRRVGAAEARRESGGRGDTTEQLSLCRRCTEVRWRSRRFRHRPLLLFCALVFFHIFGVLMTATVALLLAHAADRALRRVGATQTDAISQSDLKLLLALLKAQAGVRRRAQCPARSRASGVRVCPARRPVQGRSTRLVISR